MKMKFTLLKINKAFKFKRSNGKISIYNRSFISSKVHKYKKEEAQIVLGKQAFHLDLPSQSLLDR